MRVVLVLLALAAVWGVLGALEVVPLPFGLLERADPKAQDGDLAGAAGTEGPAGARLEGAGGRRQPTAAATPPTEPVVPPEARGSVPRGAVIRGRVVAGADAPTPVAGARVRLTRPNAITAFLKTPADGRWDVLEVKTGPDGKFAFLEVRPNSGYVVRARLGDRGSVSSRWLDVVERQVVDLGDLAPGKDGSLSGRVVDGTGAPLAGARVAVAWNVQSIFEMVLPDPDLLPEVEAEASTDADGRFRLAPLEGGKKTLVVASAAHGGTVRAGVLVEGDTVLPGDVRLDAAGVVAGRVEWEDGKPAGGASVFAIDADAMNGALFSTTAGADGSFRFEHLEGDGVRLGVYLSGVMGQPTEKTKMGTLDKVLRLPSVGAVKGRVVRKADGKPVGRFGVRLEPQEKEPWMAKALRLAMDKVVGPLGFTSPDGSFSVPAVARGPHVVAITAAGFPEGKSERFEVPVGGTGDAGTIALADGNTLSGTVRTTTGDPLARASLRLVQDKHQFASEEEEAVDVTEVFWDEPGVAPDGFTDDDGRFELPPQTPGKYVLIVEHEFAEDHRQHDIDLKSGPVADLEVRVKAAGSVRVRVVDAAGKAVRGDYVVLLRADGFRRWAESDADGVATFESVRPGPCLLRWSDARPVGLLRDFWRAEDDAARTKAYEALRADGGEHVVRGGAATEAAVRLPSRVRLLLRVEPWADDVKRIQRLILQGGVPGDEPSWADTDREVDGAFEILVEPGVYDVRAVPEPGGWNQAKVFPRVEVPDAPTHTVDLRR